MCGMIRLLKYNEIFLAYKLLLFIVYHPSKTTIVLPTTINGHRIHTLNPLS